MFHDFLNKISTGDAKILSSCIPDESIDLIFTDPPYDRQDIFLWLSNEAGRILKPAGAILVFVGISHLASAIKVLTLNSLHYRWQFIFLHLFRHGWHAPCGFSHYQSCTWFDKNGQSKPLSQVPDVRSFQAIDPPGIARAESPPDPYSHWYKSASSILYYMSAFCPQGGIVFDPLCGTGIIPAVAKYLNLKFIAFEIAPAIVYIAEKRVANTKNPQLQLFTQLPLEECAGGHQ